MADNEILSISRHYKLDHELRLMDHLKETKFSNQNKTAFKFLYYSLKPSFGISFFVYSFVLNNIIKFTLLFIFQSFFFKYNNEDIIEVSRKQRLRMKQTKF